MTSLRKLTGPAARAAGGTSATMLNDTETSRRVMSGLGGGGAIAVAGGTDSSYSALPGDAIIRRAVLEVGASSRDVRVPVTGRNSRSGHRRQGCPSAA